MQDGSHVHNRTDGRPQSACAPRPRLGPPSRGEEGKRDRLRWRERVEQEPTVFVIAGPNGAGKTTFASEFLPDFVHCRQFLNADLIAYGLSPFAPETQNMRAGRLLLERIKELSAARQNFGFETTMSGRTYVRLLSKLRQEGYRVVMFFLWLPNTELAVVRVANRVRQGGHDDPEADVRRRFGSGLSNFFHLYCPIADAWHLYDASRSPPLRIVREEDGQMTVEQPDLFSRIRKGFEG